MKMKVRTNNKIMMILNFNKINKIKKPTNSNLIKKFNNNNNNKVILKLQIFINVNIFFYYIIYK